jgi:hypothetical protein
VLILVVAVISAPAVVDGVAYLAGTGNTVTFDPVSYQTDRYVRGGCQTSTDGILETGGTFITEFAVARTSVDACGRRWAVRAGC